MKYENYVVQAKPDVEDDGFITVTTKQMVDEALPLISPKEIWPEGRKDDNGKARYDLLPPELMEGVARVLTFGADKYGERNWEQGMRWGRPFAAMMRHMWAWWRGQGRDPETGMSHLWHAACCLAFLIAYEERQIGGDDRPDTRRVDKAPNLGT